jgi:hypothetical protein
LEKSIFQTLYEIDISEKVKQKNGNKYLPWSDAWAFVKQHYPKATYEIINDDRTGNNYFTDDHTCWVETRVTIEDEIQIESLPVMNHKNQAIPATDVDACAVNKAQKRCLVKCLALFGLGLSLWTGEELSDAAKATKKEKAKEDKKAAALLKQAQDELLAVMKEKAGKSDKAKEAVFTTVEAICGTRQPAEIETVEMCNAAIEAVKKMEVKK